MVKRFCVCVSGVHPHSSFAPSAGEDGALDEGADAGETKTGAPEGRCQ